MPIKHTFRSEIDTKGIPIMKTEKLSPLKAIRWFCKECNGFAPSMVTDIKECISYACALHPFRFGKDPGLKQDLTPEQRKEKAELFKRRLGRKP